MSVQQRIVQQAANDLGTLRELLELAKKPDAIIAAHEEARKQSALTEEEIAKAAKARELISKYESISKDLQDQRDTIARSKDDHVATVQNFKDEAGKTRKELADLTTALSDKAKENEEADKRLLEAFKQIDKQKSDIGKQHKEFLEKIAKDAATNESNRLANEAEAARLDEIDRKQKLKAAKLKEAADL